MAFFLFLFFFFFRGSLDDCLSFGTRGDPDHDTKGGLMGTGRSVYFEASISDERDFYVASQGACQGSID